MGTKRSTFPTGRRAALGLLFFLVLLVATLSPAITARRAGAADESATANREPAAAADPPPPMYSCTPDVTATAQEQTDFANRWAARIEGQDPTFNLQSYLDADAIPADIAAEPGFNDATKDTLTRGCLVSKLFDVLKTMDASFGMDTSKSPPEAFPDDTVKSMLALTVFHNKPTSQPSTPAVAPQIPLPDVVGDALRGVGLDALQHLTVPTISIPSDLGILTPATQLINNLVSALQGIGLPKLPSLADLLQLPPLPISLPPLPDLSLPSITDLINTIRSVLDSTTYEVCYRGAKTGGAVRCTRTLIGLPVLLDVQGDAQPDLSAQLAPSVNLQYPTGVTMGFTLDRLPPLLNPLGSPPPVTADVWATWDVPLANMRVHLGFGSTYGGFTLPRHNSMLATVTNLTDATKGDPKIAYTLTQQGAGPESLAMAGVTKVLRADTGALSTPETTAAYLNFVGVPQTTKGTLDIRTSEAAVGKNSARFINDMTTSSPSKFKLGITRQFSPADPLSPCCPVQSFLATVDKLPTALNIDILKQDDLNRWTAHYGANANVDHLTLEGFDFPTVEDFLKPPAEQTVNTFTADVRNLPTKVDVVATLPLPNANPRHVSVDYRASKAADPNTLVVVPTFAFGTVEQTAGDVQRSLSAQVNDVPGQVKLDANLAGDSLNTPPQPKGKNLDVGLTYDASSEAHDLSVDFFDKSDSGTSKLSGNVTSLPPSLTATVSHHVVGLGGTDAIDFDAKSAPDAADGSAQLGTAFIRYAKNSDFLSLDDTTRPSTAQYAVVRSDKGPDNTASTDDDRLALEAQYAGLKRTDVSLTSDGLDKGALDLHAKVVNDLDRATTVQFDNPESTVDAEVLNVPKDVDVSYHRRQTGTTDDCGSPENTHSVVYDASGPIDKATVRVQGKLANGDPDPNNLTVLNAGRDPSTHTGPIPQHMEMFVNGHTKQVKYRADSEIGQVAASILSQSVGSGACTASSGINADLRQLPLQFGAAIDPNRLRFSDLADTTTPLTQVGLAEDTPTSTPIGSVAVAFTDHPNGTVPDVPAANSLSVESDKRASSPTKGTAASVRIAGVKLFQLDVRHENPADPDSKTTGVETKLALASELDDVGTNLDFTSEDSSEARVRGTINKLTPDLHLVLGLVEGDTQVHYQTPGGHLDTNLEIALGHAGELDTVSLPANRPVGVMLRDSSTLGNKKVGLLLLGAPSTLDLLVDKITTATRGTNDPSFLTFTDYQPPGGSADLSVDIDLKNSVDDNGNRDLSKDIRVQAVLRGVPAGYGVNVLPIAKGNDSTGGDDGTYFDMRVEGSAPLSGGVELDVGAGVPKRKNQNGSSTPIDPAPCSQCALQLTGTISNLPPGFEFNLDSTKPGPDGSKQTIMDMTLLGTNHQQDNSQSINDVKLNVLSWQYEPGTQTVRTVPQVQAHLRDVPAHMNILIGAGVPKDSSVAQPCAKSSNTLPGITYSAEGDQRDALDLDAEIDFVMLAHDPTHPELDDDGTVKEQPDPALKVSATNLSHSVQFVNTHDGKFEVTQPDPSAAPTGNLHLEVSTQILKILNWSLQPPSEGGCGFSKSIGPIEFSSAGGLRFDLSTGIVLDIDGLKNVTLDPGVTVGVSGDFAKVKFGLRDPHIVNGYLAGVGLKITVHISDSINPSFPLVFPPIDLENLSFPISINMVDLSSNSTGNWIDINLLVPCDVDVSWDGVDITSYHAYVDTHPGLLSQFSNGFETTDDGTFLVAPAGDYLQPLRFFVQPIYILALQIFKGIGSFDAGIRCPS